MVSCEKISLKFGDFDIFKDFDFSVDSGEKVSISAPSGKGKSTLLKILQGYVLPQSGTVLIDGIKVASENITEIRNKIAWVPQNINLPVETGQELIHLMNMDKSLHKINTYLGKLGLDGSFISKNFKEISGGQKQRIILSICLSMNKDLILLDEPTSSLGEDSISLLVDLVKKIENTTVISASHNQTWIENSDRVVEL